ncbi:MAG: hypothetical protein QF752_01830 [Planctomycetota bacterium]|nr:hypothetical protein [Planctomycetota bacterium]
MGAEEGSSVPGLAVGFRHATLLLMILPWILVLGVGGWLWRQQRKVQRFSQGHELLGRHEEEVS